MSKGSFRKHSTSPLLTNTYYSELKSTTNVFPSRPPNTSNCLSQRALSCQSELGSAMSYGTQRILSPFSFWIQLFPLTKPEGGSSSGYLGCRQASLNPVFFSLNSISQTWQPSSSSSWMRIRGLLICSDSGHFGAIGAYWTLLSHRKWRGLIPHTWKLRALSKLRARKRNTESKIFFLGRKGINDFVKV